MHDAKIKDIRILVEGLRGVTCRYSYEEKYVGKAIAYLNDYLDKLVKDSK